MLKLLNSFLGNKIGYKIIRINKPKQKSYREKLLEFIEEHSH